MFIITIFIVRGVLVSNQAFSGLGSPHYIVSVSSELWDSFGYFFFFAGYPHSQYTHVGYSLFWKHNVSTQVALNLFVLSAEPLVQHYPAYYIWFPWKTVGNCSHTPLYSLFVRATSGMSDMHISCIFLSCIVCVYFIVITRWWTPLEM